MKLNLLTPSLLFLASFTLAAPTSSPALEARAAKENIGCPYVWCITKTKRAPVAEAKENIGWCPYGPCITKSKAKRVPEPEPEAKPEAEAKAEAKENVGWCGYGPCITKK